ncbi:endoglucanase 19 isoform X2 [Brachypodium distachyon]|nr:endoglucanase 19 isoform X2 [Brachypodium distachyon]|eukprot:XP_024315721.1 endoglucanase 19 isoform X2 [Brachypodium distachyon]
MAFTTTMLAWSVADFGKYMGAESLAHARDAVRWGADYLLKAATATPGALYVQVGDPGRDHACWERAEDMDTPRAVYRVDAARPGSDVAGETAAALAASSVAFRRADPAYSARLLRAAMDVFDLADRHRGSYSDSLSSAVCPFYCSYSGYHDELLWAASWLHRASSSNASAFFLSYVQAYGTQLGAVEDDYSFSWDDKRAGAKVMLSRVFLRRKLPGFELYKSHSDSYVCSLVPGTNSFQASGQYTPGGLLYKEGESNMQYVTTATFLLLAYAKYLKSSGSGATVSCAGAQVAPGELVALAKRQVDYILGKNPGGRSYMVGFGARWPQRAHHRGASMPSVRAHPARIGCDAGFEFLHAPGPNPNVLVGAVLGGPDAKDGFEDDRGNYAQSEPATYINAPLVGALAFFAGTAK